ncbi:IS481 family transposase [Pseudonocardia sp. T1-2H]|uniref:IS481 family transposase n=1 Tax=Pseudonocardia sp. T1-2H TaxID=3128899 RepID=UPI003101A79D
MAHANARTTVYARRLIVTRWRAGWPAARIAEQLGISRATVYKWIRRYQTEGWAGLLDRSSRPHRSPARIPAEIEARVLALRATARRGPVFLARRLGLVASTVGRILRRNQVLPLRAIDPITGAPVRRQHSPRRYEHPRPGDLLHVDVKKLGRVPEGGGWRLHGRSEAVRGRGNGYDFLHVAVDDHSRLAYLEALPDERDPNCAGFLRRATAWFARHGVTVRRVLTDNARVYRVGRQWTGACAELQIRRRFTRPHCPWTNGRAERFNRTLLDEFAYAQAWLSNTERLAALDSWVHAYNTQRAHSAIGGHPPITRLPKLGPVNNLVGHHI